MYIDRYQNILLTDFIKFNNYEVINDYKYAIIMWTLLLTIANIIIID